MSELKKFLFMNKIEGLSYIVLLFIAMPLKYYFGYPAATKVMGSIHGALFILFLYRLYKAAHRANFSQKETLNYFILSLIPFGSFYTDKLVQSKYLKPLYSK